MTKTNRTGEWALRDFHVRFVRDRHPAEFEVFKDARNYVIHDVRREALRLVGEWRQHAARRRAAEKSQRHVSAELKRLNRMVATSARGEKADRLRNLLVAFRRTGRRLDLALRREAKQAEKAERRALTGVEWWTGYDRLWSDNRCDRRTIVLWCLRMMPRGTWTPAVFAHAAIALSIEEPPQPRTTDEEEISAPFEFTLKNLRWWADAMQNLGRHPVRRLGPKRCHRIS